MTIDTNELRQKLSSVDIVDHIDIHANVKSTLAELLDRIEVAEKDIALKEKIIDALGFALNAVANERDALQAKITEMEKQEPARRVTAVAYCWRYRGAIKWQYGELTEGTVLLAKEHKEMTDIVERRL